jgi:CRP-like cAMP-binding protein
MLTLEDIRSVPPFSTLAVAELERLAETSADLDLGAGEFAVHEGGDRALYAVLSGKIEVVKLFDGIERTLGWRVPGTIFGEVPIAFCTVFVGGYRASEPSRVLRVDPKQYYAVAATSPEVVAKVGALARERMGGLQGIAAEAPNLPHRCGKFRRSGRLVLCQSCADGDTDHARRFPGKEHVPLSDRATQDQVERERSAARGSRRRAWRHQPDLDRHPRQREQRGDPA